MLVPRRAAPAAELVAMLLNRARAGCLRVLRSAGVLGTAQAATCRRIEDKTCLIIAPATIQGLSAAQDGREDLLEVWISKRPCREKAVIE